MCLRACLHSSRSASFPYRRHTCMVQSLSFKVHVPSVLFTVQLSASFLFLAMLWVQYKSYAVGNEIKAPGIPFLYIVLFCSLQVLPLVHVELEPGDALFFHCNVLHQSDQNSSDRRRWAFLIAYNRASNSPVNNDHQPQFTPLVKVYQRQTKLIFYQRMRTCRDCNLYRATFSVLRVMHKETSVELVQYVAFCAGA